MATRGEENLIADLNEFVRQTSDLLENESQTSGIRPNPVIEVTEQTLDTTRFGFNFGPQPETQVEPIEPGEETPPSVTGACCVGEICSIHTEDFCNAIGGTYQGDGTDCDPNPCLEIGACCHDDCTCDDTTMEDCVGTWHSGILCVDDPCVDGCCCSPIPISIETTATTTRELEGDNCRNWTYSAGPVNLTLTKDDAITTCDFQKYSEPVCGEFNCDNAPFVSEYNISFRVHSIDCEARTFLVNICWFSGCINDCDDPSEFCVLPDACGDYGPFSVDDHTATIDDTITPGLPSGTGSTTVHSVLTW